ncbi:myosin-1-like [Coccinella septempunctata]|uniref:myosin-1-like n=1 Tax=Coccinella septempunctata TaxID=41139 RepID=UPI001D07DA0F|nr:myosin-1-like [Coccinella septempunctata]
MKKSQNQNMDTASNCEAYMSRLFRKEKSTFSTSGFKTTTNNVKPKSSANKYSSKTKPSGRSQSSNHTSGKGCPSCTAEGNSNVHKEIYVENPVVEITTKSKPRSRSNAAGDREPWGRLLQTANNENSSKFSTFDPLRTIHFLAKELQFKLQNDLPDDNNLQQIIIDMQHALTRVPPEIASAIKLQHSSDTIPLRKSSSSNSVLLSKRTEEERLKIKANKSCQTIQKYEDAELIKKIMEGSTMKLEASCRQMEMLCGRLKSEKEDLEEQLKTERENVKFLKKRVGELEVQTDQLVSVTIQRLEEEKNELQLQVNKLTDVVDSQSVHTSYELKTVTQELKQVQMKADQECSKLKHQLALANMEKEKYIAILTVRDKQISEIRSEMSQLQDVVNEQLMDIHNNALTELPSTNSLETENAWIMRDNGNDESENQSNFSLAMSENPLNFAQKDSKSFIDLPSGDPTTLSDEKIKSNHNQNILKNKQSIRNMFDELKKQAFAVTSVSSKS